jgi:hypothetical protein
MKIGRSVPSSDRVAIILAAITIVSLRPTSVRAWGVEGHHIVARIAWSQMTPATKHGVQNLLGADDFVRASTWADEVRPQRPETYNWHFVDIPYRETKFDPLRDCKPTDRGDCIIAELERTRRVLSDATGSTEEQKEALKFLMHFVGDLHQPLHVIDDLDRGGNDVHVTLAGQPAATVRGTANLHGVWDTTFISQAGLDETAYAESLIADLTAHPVPQTQVDFAKWAEDGHRIGVQVAYAFDGFSSTGPPAGVVELSTEYQRAALSVIGQQLELAGVRLARLLNELFGTR